MRSFACLDKVDWLVKNCHLSPKQEKVLRQASAFIKAHPLFSRTAPKPIDRILSIKDKRVSKAVIKQAELELSKTDKEGKPLMERITEPEIITIMNLYEKQYGLNLTGKSTPYDSFNRFRFNKSQMAYLNELIKSGHAKSLSEAITLVFKMAKNQTAG